MIRDTLKLLEYERKKKPEIHRLLVQIEDGTDEDLSRLEAEVSSLNAMKWVRNALMLAIRKRRSENAFARLPIVDGTVPDPVGEMRRWRHADTFILGDRGTETLVRTDDLLWFSDAGGVMMGTIFSAYVDPRLRDMSAGEGRVRQSAYRNEVRRALREKYGAEPMPTVAEVPSGDNVLGEYNVRVQR